uniref:Uncharacterized protein n=1 Tax=Oryza brachyantha TaxID=4533 RepID=J3LGG9_ORYBR
MQVELATSYFNSSLTNAKLTGCKLKQRATCKLFFLHQYLTKSNWHLALGRIADSATAEGIATLHTFPSLVGSSVRS